MATFRWSTLPELRERTSMKWRAYPPEVLPLWVAEMDCALAPPVVEALHAAIARSDTGYPAGNDYAEALAAFASRQWGWDGLDPERCRLVPDVMLGVVEILGLVSGPGDAVVVAPPVYGPFFAFIESAGRQVVEATLTEEGRLDLEVLAAAFVRARQVGPRPVFLLCNPHNPTGTVHSRAELEAVAALAREHGVRIVADEIHAPIVLPGARFTPLLSVAGAENAFAVTSASKAFNLAGLKAAVACAGPEAAADLARMPEEVGHGASHIAVMAHTAALQGGDMWLEEMLAAVDTNRLLVRDLVDEHLSGVTFRPPEGTYLAWLDCRGLSIADDDAAGRAVQSDVAGPARFFLEEARVALSSGHVFGTGGAGHVRLNMATSADVLEAAVRAMGEAVRRA